MCKGHWLQEVGLNYHTLCFLDMLLLTHCPKESRSRRHSSSCRKLIFFLSPFSKPADRTDLRLSRCRSSSARVPLTFASNIVTKPGLFRRFPRSNTSAQLNCLYNPSVLCNTELGKQFPLFEECSWLVIPAVVGRRSAIARYESNIDERGGK